MQKHGEAFGADFEENKKALEELALIPSKQLRNRIAGYITKQNQEEPVGDAEASSEEQKE